MVGSRRHRAGDGGAGDGVGGAHLEMAGSRWRAGGGRLKAARGERQHRVRDSAGQGTAGQEMAWAGPVLRWLARGGRLEVVGSRQCGVGDSVGGARLEMARSRWQARGGGLEAARGRKRHGAGDGGEERN